MHSVRFTTETSSNGVLKRDFIVGEVPRDRPHREPLRDVLGLS
jgi:hypothetical protein